MSQNTNPARGMRDFLPEDIRRREYVISIIKDVYQKYGFEPLETPAVENIETLMGKYGEEGNQLIFKILKRGEGAASGEADLALRYDLTVPTARVVAQYKDKLPRIFKRYQIQPVWRADRPARGRFREFYQCDVDVFGTKSLVVEAELCMAVSEVLQRLGFDDFVIRVNHRKLLVELLNAAGVLEDKHTDALIALDKLDKIGREGVANEFHQSGISPSSSEKLLVFFESLVKSSLKDTLGKSPTEKLIELQKQLAEKESIISDQNYQREIATKQILEMRDSVLKLIETASEQDLSFNTTDLKFEADRITELTELVKKIAPIADNVIRLKTITTFLRNNGADESDGIPELSELIDLCKSPFVANRMVIDPSLARGLSYYTGAIFEINVQGLAGSLGGGGRYDNLIGMFSGQELPACGFSLGLERIILIMTEREMFPEHLTKSSADVLVTIWTGETVADSLELANDLRAQGLRVSLYPEADKIGKQLKYAASIGVSAVAIIGDDERANNTVTIKYLETGTQETIARDRLHTDLKI